MGTEIFFGKSEIKLDSYRIKSPGSLRLCRVPGNLPRRAARPDHARQLEWRFVSGRERIGRGRHRNEPSERAAGFFCRDLATCPPRCNINHTAVRELAPATRRVEPPGADAGRESVAFAVSSGMPPAPPSRTSVIPLPPGPPPGWHGCLWPSSIQSIAATNTIVVNTFASPHTEVPFIPTGLPQWLAPLFRVSSRLRSGTKSNPRQRRPSLVAPLFRCMDNQAAASKSASRITSPTSVRLLIPLFFHPSDRRPTSAQMQARHPVEGRGLPATATQKKLVWSRPNEIKVSPNSCR
jgi:hypothetical protein